MIKQFVILAALVCLASCSPQERVSFEQSPAIDARPFLLESELLRGISKETWASFGLKEAAVSTGEVKCVVVPHHSVAATLAAESISRLVEGGPPSVIILAPNHYNTGAAAVSTTRDFLCYDSRVAVDAAAVKRLSGAGLISIDDGPFFQEHSVGMLIPLIAWYLPDAKVIPIIFHHGYDEKKIIEIIDGLTPEIDNGAAIIASIDFSHYLPMEEAMGKDREMRGYLLSGDTETIRRLDSSYIDAPTIMTALLERFGTGNMEITANTNSGAVMQNPVSPCTSYFTIVFSN